MLSYLWLKNPLGASSDITFVASIFTGALATFGLSTGNGNKKNGNGEPKKPNNKKHEEINSAFSSVITQHS